MAEPGTEAKAAIVARYRATDRFKEALKIISPSLPRRAECEYAIATALWGVDLAAKMTELKSVRTPAHYREDLRELRKALKAAIKHAPRAFPPQYRIRRDQENPVRLNIEEELKRHLEETEQAINWNSKRLRKGSRPVSLARTEAADGAYLLIERYGKELPTRTRRGDWDKLASVLFGNPQADLWDYLREFWVSEGRLVVSERHRYRHTHHNHHDPKIRRVHACMICMVSRPRRRDIFR